MTDYEANNLGNVLRTRGVDPALLADTHPSPWEPLGRVRLAVDATEPKLPARYRNAATDNHDVIQWVRQVVEAAYADAERQKRPMPSVAAGPSMLLLGPTGTGKTHQVHGAIRLIAACGVHPRSVFASAADLYAALRPRHGVDSETEFNRFANAGLLVIDDIGAAKLSEWTEEVDFRLINHRYEREAPTVFTSNLKPKELVEGLGERVASRLREMCTQVSLKGDDRRRAAA